VKLRDKASQTLVAIAAHGDAFTVGVQTVAKTSEFFILPDNMVSLYKNKIRERF